MADRTIADIAEKMRDIDIAFLTTTTDGGEPAARPMSNNQDVDYDGDSYYFTYQDSRTVTDIAKNPDVGLCFSGDDGFYVSVTGEADLIRDKAEFEQHWNPDLDKWFENGVETQGIVLIKVSAGRVKWWDGEENGEITDFS